MVSILFLHLSVFCHTCHLQWIAVPFSLYHEALAGRSIFYGAIPIDSAEHNVTSSSSSPGNRSSYMSSMTTMASAAGEFTITWIGSLSKEDVGIWIDSALLLVFGGIPWQVRSTADQEIWTRFERDLAIRPVLVWYPWQRTIPLHLLGWITSSSTTFDHSDFVKPYHEIYTNHTNDLHCAFHHK